jgi:uncharacterized protein (DUF1810 family)
VTDDGGVSDDYHLQRFVDAQDAADTYAQAVRELRAGRKQSHWMWFVFPQIAGLGSSAMAQRFAITGLAEAAAYLDHPVLGARLRQCAQLLITLDDEAAAVDIFGSIDAQKLQSSMTLFAHAAPAEPVFQQVLKQYFGGQTDAGTTTRL